MHLRRLLKDKYYPALLIGSEPHLPLTEVYTSILFDYCGISVTCSSMFKELKALPFLKAIILETLLGKN